MQRGTSGHVACKPKTEVKTSSVALKASQRKGEKTPGEELESGTWKKRVLVETGGGGGNGGLDGVACWPSLIHETLKDGLK
jgi:hypothetical protein